MRILIVPLGRFEHENGIQVIDEGALRRIVEFAAESSKEITVDFDHASLVSHNAAIAGTVDPGSLEITGSGLTGELELSDSAIKLVNGGKYRYLSPVFVFDPIRSKDRELYIESLAGIGLTNSPNIAKMPELTEQFHKEERMKELFDKLRSALSLPPETEDSAALEGVMEAFDTLGKELARIKEALGLDPQSGTEDVLAAIGSQATGTPFAPSEEEWNALKEEIARLGQKGVSDSVHNAVANGKILPAQREWAMGYAAGDPQGFEGFLANSRAVVSFGEVIPKNRSARTEKPSLDPAQQKVNSLLGIERELFDKYNKS